MKSTQAVLYGAMASYLSLFALIVAWLLWLAPPPSALISTATLVLLVPLLVPLRGVLTGRRYTMAWSSMLILFYFAHGVSAAAGRPPERWLGVSEALLSVCYFTLALSYIRLTRSRGARRQAHS